MRLRFFCLLFLTSFDWTTWGMPIALPPILLFRRAGKNGVAAAAFLGPRGGSTIPRSSTTRSSTRSRRPGPESFSSSSSVHTTHNKSRFWPPWPLRLLAANRHGEERDDQDEDTSVPLGRQAQLEDGRPAAATATTFEIWPLVRDMATLSVKQLSRISRNLFIHLPPGMPPLLLYAVFPRTVVHKATATSAPESVVAEVERVIPLISNPFVRNVALSGFTLALISWAHSELHRQRCLTPLGMEDLVDENYQSLPPFLPEMPQTPASMHSSDDLVTSISSLLPPSWQTTVLQWAQLRTQRTQEQQRERRLSVEEKLLALQRRKNGRRGGGARNKLRTEQISSFSEAERLALVTGASRGIGRAIAVELARYGINLILVARDLERLNGLGTDLEKYYGVKCYVVTADLGQPNGADQLFQATKNANLSVDILVNNAGYSLQGPSSVDMNVAETNKLIQCNAASVSTLMHLFGNDMKHRRRGRILNISSICGAVAGIPTVAVYSATKAFCNSLSTSMALELEPFGVGVTSCMPGAVQGTAFKARSATDEALCWKWPGYAKNPEQIAQVSVQAMLRGDTECTPGWENRFFLRVMKPAIPQRLHNVVAGIFWNPLQLPFRAKPAHEQRPFSQATVENDSSQKPEPEPQPQMSQDPPKRSEMEQNEITTEDDSPRSSLQLLLPLPGSPFAFVPGGGPSLSVVSRPRSGKYWGRLTTLKGERSGAGRTRSESDSTEYIKPQPRAQVGAVICGGGPAGLLTAIMLAQELPEALPKIHVYDRLAPPPPPDDETLWDTNLDKFYLIGLGGRGQQALRRFGVWESVIQNNRSVPLVGRRDWPPNDLDGPGVEEIFAENEKTVTTYVLPRDKLVGILRQEILQHYSNRIALRYGYELRPLDFAYNEGTQVLVQVSQCNQTVSTLNFSQVKTSTQEAVASDFLCDVDSAPTTELATDLLIAADGTVRTVANAMQILAQERMAKRTWLQRLGPSSPEAFSVTRYPDDNQRIYKTIPLQLPLGWRSDLDYSARSQDGRVVFDALPANNRGSYCGVLLLRTTDPLADAGADATALRELLDEYLPRFSELVDDATVQAVAQKPASYLPGFRYAGPRLHQGNRCVLLGDCAHTVKPYFGLGANSALEDVSILCDVLRAKNYDLTASVLEYSIRQAPQAKELVRLSRDLDRPGLLGLLTFVLPIVLDAIFGKLFPQLFMPNVIRMLQREDVTFVEVARRKRLDRLVQVSLLGALLTFSFWLLEQSLQFCSFSSGNSVTTLSTLQQLPGTVLALDGDFWPLYGGTTAVLIVTWVLPVLFSFDLASSHIDHEDMDPLRDNDTLPVGMEGESTLLLSEADGSNGPLRVSLPTDLQSFSSNVSYFYLKNELGLSEEVMWKITYDAGAVLGMTADNIRAKVDLLRELMDLNDEEVRVMIERQPSILQLSSDKNLSPTILHLLRSLDLTRLELKTLIVRFPGILTYSIANLRGKIHFYTSVLGLSKEDARQVFLKEPTLFKTGLHSGLFPRMRFLVRDIQLPMDNLRRIVVRHPRILSYSLENNLIPKLVYYCLMTLQLEPAQVAQLLTKYPEFLVFNLDQQILPITRYFLQDLDFSLPEFQKILLRYPRLVTNSLTKIKHVVGYLRFETDLNAAQVRRILYQAPSLIGLSTDTTLRTKASFIRDFLSLEDEEWKKLLTGLPTILLLSLEHNLHPKLRYLHESFQSDTVALREAILRLPTLLGYSLEKRIIPRMEAIQNAGLHDPGCITIGIPMKQESFEKWLKGRTRKLELEKRNSQTNRDITASATKDADNQPTGFRATSASDRVIHWTRKRNPSS